MTKSALIWGINGGIGAGLRQRLTVEDWQVAGTVRQAGLIQPGSALVFEADVANPVAVQHVVRAIAQEIEQVDWWIYAAGDILSKPFADTPPEEWKRILDANLHGVFSALHFSLPLLSKECPVYILGAVSERMRLPGLSAYAAAKAGVEALGEVLRKELRRTVVVVRPGAVDTRLWQKVPFRLPPSALSADQTAEKIWQAYINNWREPFLDI